MAIVKDSLFPPIVLRMKIYRTTWGSLKMKIVACSNLWVKRTLKLNTLRRRERRSDWLWRVQWTVVHRAKITAAPSPLMSSLVQAHRAWRGMQPPPKSWSCPRRTESCPLKSNERSRNPNKTPAKSKSSRRRYPTHGAIYFRGDE